MKYDYSAYIHSVEKFIHFSVQGETWDEAHEQGDKIAQTLANGDYWEPAGMNPLN